VLNMSLAGACFSCQGNLSEHLRTTPVLRNCTLSIPGVGDIGCDLEVRSFEFRRQPYRYTVVGVLLDGLNSGASKLLEQYLVMVQRQQRRETTRS
ncbi:MAG: hypothetical protein WAR81_14760, partial [Pseudomonadales bacterium]